MARRFLDSIRDDINLLWADNTSGQITAQALRNIVLDIVDSTIQDESAISGNTEVSGISVPTTFLALNNGIFTDEFGGDGQFLFPVAATGIITTSATAGYTYELKAAVSIEGQANNEWEFVILANGTPLEYRPNIATFGPGRTVSVYLDSYINGAGAPPSTTIQLGVRSVSGTQNLTVTGATLSVIIFPTNNPS